MRKLLSLLFLFSGLVNGQPQGQVGDSTLTLRDGRLSLQTPNQLIRRPDRFVNNDGSTSAHKNVIYFESMINVSGRLFLIGHNKMLFLVGPEPVPRWSQTPNSRILFWSLATMDAAISLQQHSYVTGMVLGAALGVYGIARPRAKVYIPVTRILGLVIDGKDVMFDSYTLHLGDEPDIKFQRNGEDFSVRELLAKGNCQTFLDKVPPSLKSQFRPPNGALRVGGFAFLELFKVWLDMFGN